MDKITKDEIDNADTQTIELGEKMPGLGSLLIECNPDMDIGAPWENENEDGHGPVSEWTTRDKAPGEWVLCTDRRSKRFYDFQAAMKLARADKWGLGEEDLAKLTAELERTPTRGEICAEAVNHDFKFLKGWCNNEWQYVVVTVTLTDAAGETLWSDSLCGIEGFGDYWREYAAETANSYLEMWEKEQAEAQHWAERDVETVKGGAS